MVNNEEFFDGISGFYDEMISFDAALVNRKKALAALITPEMKSAADLGCGTGLDSLALAQNGLAVTSFDISEGMLNKAKEKAKQLSLDIKFYKTSLTQIPHEYFGKFDLVVSLGNTIANISRIDLEKVIHNAHELLKENGTLIIQILNYKPLENKNERIINITQSSDKYFVRFYDFYTEYVQFNILSFDKNNPKQRELTATMLFPHEAELFKEMLVADGFINLELHGDFSKSTFDKSLSKDLILKAKKDVWK